VNRARLASLAGALALAAPWAARPAGEAPAVERLAAELADAAARTVPAETTVLGVAVEAPGVPALAGAIEGRLVDRLRAAGFRGAFLVAREAADAAGADAHLRLAVGIDDELSAAGDVAAVRVNFFTGRPTGPGGLVSAAVPADREARLLARSGPAPRPAAVPVTVRRWAALPAAPLALAAGDLDGDGRPEVAVLDPAAVWVLAGDGTEVAHFPLPPPGPGAIPSRDPAGALAIAEGTVRWFATTAGAGGALRLEAGTLVDRGGAAAGAVPLAAGAAGTLVASPLRGTNAFGPGIGRGAAAAQADGPILGAAAAPRPGPVAFALARDDGAVELLGPDLAPTAPPLADAGAAVALADLDGDGAVELVASGLDVDPPDRVRVFAIEPGAAPGLRFESDDLPARLLAGAAADLDGDGRDEALLAGPAAGGGAAIWSVREARR
jgi:hypothetical protein